MAWPRAANIVVCAAGAETGTDAAARHVAGCQQTAETFAAATRMNEAADDVGIAVLYPEQSLSVSALRCWNWFSPAELDSRGDAAEIAGLTRQVIRENKIDATRVYVAGMSAGGAMAVALTRTYPDLYAAMGVHSGLPAGLANDLHSAMRLMSSGPATTTKAAAIDNRGAGVASIVFHGDEDEVVHPSNGAAIHAVRTTRAVVLKAQHRSHRQPLAQAPVSAVTRALSTLGSAARHGASFGSCMAAARWAGGNDSIVTLTRAGLMHRAKCCAFFCSIDN